MLVALPLFALVSAPTDARSPLTFAYLLPAPGARHVSPATSLAFRQGSPFAVQHVNPDLFSVTGSRSGRHSGTVRLSDDRLTILYYPNEPFMFGETVTVVVRPGLVTENGDPIGGISYQFTTLERDVTLPALAAAGNEFSLVPPADIAPSQAPPGYRTYPEFSNVMTVTVTTPAQDTDIGFLFIAGMGILSASDPSLFILDDAGEPIYIQRTPSGLIVTDFKVQVVNGTPYLVYYIGLGIRGWASGTYYVMDQSYTLVDRWTVNNGYGADLHDIRLLDNGHALLLSYTPIPVDLTPYGGPADGIVVDVVVQEQDTAKNVVFEWHGSQHIPLTDTYISLRESPADFIHTNAIEVDYDGHLLLSNRNLSEITKINRQTGQIIWRLGGRRNQFTFTNDIGFSFQHDIRRLPDGRITLFDNGNQHSPPHSRAVQYDINEGTKILTRLWQYPEDTSIYAPFMGSFQRLSNGNALIGWGALPKVTEVHSDGSKALEIAMGGLSYRAYRYPWQALPAELPRIAIDYSSNPTTATIYSSWNGATLISDYEVYAGPNENQMSLVATTPRTGFETITRLTGLDPATCIFKVRPVHAEGLTTPFSASIYRLDRPQCRALLNFHYFPSVMK